MDMQHRLSLPLVKANRKKDTSRLKGPLRVVRLCVLSIVLPGLLVAGPLYLRYRVYSEQMYPVGISDMRLVDNRISTTWCQSQLVKSNATFNAYLLPEQPDVKVEPLHVSTVRHVVLEDDMKEYWGFYLLKGSSVTVSSCSRWPGASLIVIRGHNHLRECAYIGDNSSEEDDELEEIQREKEEEEARKKEKQKGDLGDGESNEPWLMKRARPGVQFHVGEELEDKYKLSHESDSGDNEHFSGQIIFPHKKTPSVTTNTRNPVQSTQDSSHEMYLKINKTGERNGSEEVFQDMLTKLLQLGNRGQRVLSKLRQRIEDDANEDDAKEVDGEEEMEAVDGKNLIEEDEKGRQKREVVLTSLQHQLSQHDDKDNHAQEEGVVLVDEIRGSINGTTHNDRSNSEFWSSFSSSEERLLSCAGLILNLPLTPQIACSPDSSEEVRAGACEANKLTYKVPRNGYYFFVFSSENEIQPNYIRVHFQLEKVIYNVSNPIASCTNATEECSLPLNFFSREKVVLELPVSANESQWNQEYVVVSTCEPRTVIYAACVIAVPILILLFAF